MEDKRQIREINASSMADIAFLLLIFFLVATTMNVDTGITRQLPPIPPDEIQAKDQDVRKRDLLGVFVSRYERIQLAGGLVTIDQVKDRVKEFILNPTDDPNMPEKEVKQIPLPDGSIWTYAVSKGVISLTNDMGTSYDLYVQVQNELTRAYNEMRNEVSRSKFGKDFLNLSDGQREAVRQAIPQQISEGELKDTGGN